MPTVLKDFQGPDWPLGFIEVTAPGDPVQITTLIDPTGDNAPEIASSSTSNEYTPRFQQIMFQGFKENTHGMQVNTGFVYIVRAGGDRDDYGTIVKVLWPGETFYLASAPAVRDVFSPYRYFIDADNANDGALVVGLTF